MPVDVGNLIFDSSAFSKTSLNIWQFTVHILLKPGLENFEPYFTSMWDECNQFHHFMANRWGNNGNSETLFLGAPKSLQMVTAAMKLKDACSLEEKLYQPRQQIKKQRHYFANKGPSSQSYGFSSSHVWMWQLDYKESWVPKNWCFWTVVLEKTLESALDCQEVQPVHPKGD